HKKRNDHVRKDDDVAQRQDRISADFAGNEWRLWFGAGHGPKSFMLCPSPLTLGKKRRGRVLRKAGRRLRECNASLKTPPPEMDTILAFSLVNTWRRVLPESSKPENSSK